MKSNNIMENCQDTADYPSQNISFYLYQAISVNEQMDFNYIAGPFFQSLLCRFALRDYLISKFKYSNNDIKIYILRLRNVANEEQFQETNGQLHTFTKQNYKQQLNILIF